MRQGTVRKGRKELWIRLEWRDATVRPKRWHLILVEQGKSNLSSCNLPCHILTAQFCAWASEVMMGCGGKENWKEQCRLFYNMTWSNTSRRWMEIQRGENSLGAGKQVSGGALKEGTKVVWERHLLWWGILGSFVLAELPPLLLKGPSIYS